jgi:hypothetical protein
MLMTSDCMLMTSDCMQAGQARLGLQLLMTSDCMLMTSDCMQAGQARLGRDARMRQLPKMGLQLRALLARMHRAWRP